MKSIRNIMIISLFFLTSLSLAQTGEWWKRDKETGSEEPNRDTVEQTTSNDTVFERGDVTISKDARIAKLIKFKSAKIPPATAPKKDGFRVQLFFDQDRKQVDEARSKMLQIQGNADTYVEYKAPNYNLLLGNYRTRLEAEKARAALLSDFPEAIIVKDRIYFPDLKKTRSVK